MPSTKTNKQNNPLLNHILGYFVGITLTLTLGTIFSCSIYKILNQSSHPIVRGIAESIRNVFGSSGACYDVPLPVTRLVSPPPTINEINRAIAKLENMNHNEILEFPVEGKENYRVIGFKENNTYYGWNVKNVKEFLEEGLINRGQFSKTSQIILIISNQSTKQRLVLKPISKNSPLGIFVKVLN